MPYWFVTTTRKSLAYRLVARFAEKTTKKYLTKNFVGSKFTEQNFISFVNRLKAAKLTDPYWVTILTFKQLLLQNQDRIYNLCRHMLGNPHDAEDAAQDVFIKAYRNLENFTPEASLYTWLYRIPLTLSKDLFWRKELKKTYLMASHRVCCPIFAGFSCLQL